MTSRAIVGCFLLLSSLQAQPTAKKPLTIDDLYRFDAPTFAVLSPDGKTAVYVRQWIDATTKRERHSLWLDQGHPEKRRPLEKGEPDGRAPIFSPDGKWIAFLSNRPRPEGWKQTLPVPPESDVAVDLWLIPSDGGTAIPLAQADKTHGRVFHDGFYGRVSFSPNGKQLVFVADDGSDPRTKEEIENDVQIVRPDQGEGYTGYGAAQLWLADLDPSPTKHAAKRIERLTKDEQWYGDPQWSPDGKALAFHVNRSKDRESARFSINKDFNIELLDLESRVVRRLTRNPGPDVSPRFSADGKRLVCLSVPRKGSHRDVFNFTLITLDDDKVRTETLFDHHGPKGEEPPHPPASFPLPIDCWDDGEHLIYSAERGSLTDTIRVDLKTGKGEKFDVKTSERRTQLARLVPPGNTFLKDRVLGDSKVVSWNNGENKRVDGVLTLPHDSVAKAPYKLIVYPHGGPHSRSVLGFNFTVEVFAANGYAVFQPNFRGSSGYGQKFVDADRFDLGGGDMRDILSGIDYLIKEKIVDKDRQFVYGISYGGFMTTWLVGQTRQFRAAVAQNAVTDLNVMWGLSDIQSWTEWEFGGKPWDVAELMRKHSPLTYAARVRTPTLILHSREDRRCPLPMGQMYHQALRSRDVPTQLVIYPDEGHGIRQPRHRADVLKRTLAWFEQYDKK